MESTTGQTPSPGRVRVWDAPLRLFHWSFAATFIVAWLSRDDTRLDIHVFSGYLFAALLLFRLWWGWAGEPHARFSDFLFPPARLRDWLTATLRGRPPRHLGHNPGGAWAVFAMLGLGALISVTGLFALGGEEGHGPFAGILDFEQGARMHEVHEWLAWLMLALTVLHVAGVWLESRWHRENLVAAMITGYKPLRRADDAGDARPRRAVAAAMLAAMMLYGAWWVAGYQETPGGKVHRLFTAEALPLDASWSEECGDCHLAFHPTLLPARSWQRLLDGQEDHFGEDLALDPDTLRRLNRYALAHAAESTPTEAAWKILRAIPPDDAPLRITATRYWRDKHQDIPERVWRDSRVGAKYNCDACHLDAEAATFEDSAMRLPRGLDPEPPDSGQ